MRLGQFRRYETRAIYLFVTVAFTLASASIALAQERPNETANETASDSITSTNDSISDRPATGYEIFDLRTADLDAMDGTIIGNRSSLYISFFLEGTTYKLTPDHAISLNLPRSAAMLNLYGCDSQRTINRTGCYWDVHLVEQGGIYDIVSGATAGQAVNLTLLKVEEGAISVVWIQNRTDAPETIIYDNQAYELAPAVFQKFVVAQTFSPIFYLRSCLIVDNITACEWVAQSIEINRQYGLIQNISNLNSDGQTKQRFSLQPIDNLDEEIQAPPQFTCQTQVPVVNVRSGPGLEYVVLTKIRQTDQHGGELQAIGRDSTLQWLAVKDDITQNGWVTSNSNYITCSGDIQGLDEIPVLDGRLAATSTPIISPPTTTPILPKLQDVAPTPLPVPIAPTPLPVPIVPTPLPVPIAPTPLPVPIAATPFVPYVTPTRQVAMAQPTVTPIPTWTPFPTWTPIPTFTPYPTLTPVIIVQYVVVPTSTPLPTNSPTPVYTATPLPTPTPLPTATSIPTATPTPIATFTPEADSLAEETESAPTNNLDIPQGFGRLTVINSFHHSIRFTLDQTYRVYEDVSEYDLDVGDQVSIIVYPGVVRFSASTPWSGGLAGNMEVDVEEDSELELNLGFYEDPKNEGEWILYH